MKKAESKIPDTDDQNQVEIDPVHKAIATDEYAGQGGSYLYDPETGKRTPITD